MGGPQIRHKAHGGVWCVVLHNRPMSANGRAGSVGTDGREQVKSAKVSEKMMAKCLQQALPRGHY